MRAAVVPPPGRAAIARTAASGVAPPLMLASEGVPTTLGASGGAAFQSGKRKRDEEPVVRALSLLPTPVVAAQSQRAGYWCGQSEGCCSGQPFAVVVTGGAATPKGVFAALTTHAKSRSSGQ
eukprot:scaffold3219_cov105-Isochrysis_galbana.AAC.7